MKQPSARQSCRIILNIVIWDVVNRTQALKKDEVCVDSFPLKSYQLEKKTCQAGHIYSYKTYFDIFLTVVCTYK